MANQFIINGMATIGILVKVLLATPIGRVADKVGRKKVYYFLNPVVVVSYLLLVLIPNTYPQLLLPAVLRGFDTVSRIVIIGSMTPELISPEYLGRWRGILGLFGGYREHPLPDSRRHRVGDSGTKCGVLGSVCR